MTPKIGRTVESAEAADEAADEQLRQLSWQLALQSTAAFRPAAYAEEAAEI